MELQLHAFLKLAFNWSWVVCFPSQPVWVWEKSLEAEWSASHLSQFGYERSLL